MTLHDNEGDVKRPKRSPLRDEHARLTRTAILDAAHELFLADGYAATSISKIARAAGLSEQTIYNTFGDKPTLLYEVGVRIVSGELASDEATKRDFATELTTEPDPMGKIRIAAAWSRMTWEQGMLQFETMLLDAAATDPRVADIANQAWEQKYRDNERLFPLVFPEPARHNDALDDQLDLLFAIDSAAFVRILIEDRGWSWDKYEEWLATILQRLLLNNLE